MATKMDTSKLAEAEWGSDVIAEALRRLGIEYVALNPGATFRGIHDSFVNYLGNTKPEMILCNHEEIAVAIAHGYGRAAGRPMAAFVHYIVGLLHASMAIFNAWMGRDAVLVLGGTGPVDADHRRPCIDWIHTANVQGTAVRDIVKWDDQPGSLAASVITTEPKGPAYVCFDTDIQEQRLTEPFELPDFSRFPAPTRFQADPAALDEAAAALLHADQPVLLVNALGRTQAGPAGLLRLAESLAVPVITGGDLFSFPTRHPLYATDSGNDLLAAADLIVAFDVYDLEQMLTRLDRATRKTEDIIRPEAKLIDVSLRQLNVKSWADDHGRLYPTSLSVAADTAVALPALADRVQERLSSGDGSPDEIEARRARIAGLHEAARDRSQAAASGAAGEHPPCPLDDRGRALGGGQRPGLGDRQRQPPRLGRATLGGQRPLPASRRPRRRRPRPGLRPRDRRRPCQPR